MKFKRKSIVGLLVAMGIVFAGIGFAYAQTAADVDFNDDGVVGVDDFLLFIAKFGTSQGDGKYEAKYDLDGDGQVGGSDFLVFVGFFGQIAGPMDDIEMVWIEPGTFQMGSPSSEPGRDSDEGPVHEVTISQGFYLGKYEVTQGQWESVMGTRPWQSRSYVRSGLNYPAVFVSWGDAQEFIRRLNTSLGSEVYRLPTEAEWEYACRAGTTTRWSFGDDESQLGDDESQLGDYAWYRDNAWDVGERYSHSVGTKRANPWGLYDMHGNVWEWVQDWYDRDYYRSSPSVDPAGPSSGSVRVLRGGDFGHHARNVRSAIRATLPPGHRYSYVGFRLLRQAP